MASRYVHISEIFNFRGLDLRSSDMTRARGFDSDGTQNTMPSPQGGIKTRYGHKFVTSNFGTTGLTTFTTTSLTGTTKTEVLAFGTRGVNESTYPWRLVKSTFRLTNSHDRHNAIVSHLYDEVTSQFRFKIVRNNVAILDQGVGLGTATSDHKLSSLETSVDALAYFSMSTPANATTTPTAFVELIDGATIPYNGGTFDVIYYYWEAIPNAVDPTASQYATVANPMLEVGAESMRNVSTAQVQSVLYMSSGSTTTGGMPGGAATQAVITKYDGQDFYRAGFGNSDVENLTTAHTTKLAAPYSGTDSKGARTVGGTSTLTGNYFYRHSIVRIDNTGLRIESELSKPAAAAVAPAGQVTRVDCSGIDKFYTDTYGYGFRGAQVNGAQNAKLTITVDSGHNMVSGSIAYFWASNQGRFIQREVLSVTSTSIQISSASLDTNTESPNYDSGGSVNVLNDAKISNNFRLAIYRTKSDGTSLFLVEEIPISATNPQQEFDDMPDSSLGAEYVEPDYPHSAPPKGRYICTFNDQLIISGDDLNPNTVYFSDISPEYFPKDTHSFDLEDRVTGVCQSGEVLVAGTRNSLSVVTGDLINFSFRVSKIGNNIGVTSHASMQEAMEGVLMFNSYKGPYFLVGGRDLQPLGASVDQFTGQKSSRIESFFTKAYNSTEEKPVLERALGAVLANDSIYLLFVPFEDPTKPSFATSNSVVFAYDYQRDSWHKWTGLNMAGGITVCENRLLFSSRSYDGTHDIDYTGIKSYFSEQQRLKGRLNFADHGSPISFCRRSHWEALGNHGKFKRFLKCKVISDEAREGSITPLTLKTYVDRDSSKLSTSDSLTFTTQKELTPKLKSEVCQSLQVAFESSAYYAPVSISGYLLEAIASFRAEIKE